MKLKFGKERKFKIACSQHTCRHHKSIIGADQNCGKSKMKFTVESCRQYYPEQFFVDVKI